MIKLKNLLELKSPYPLPTINDKKRGYIGIVNDNIVYGYNQLVPNPMEIDHSELIDSNMINHMSRFRYFVLDPKNTIIWTDIPTKEDKLKVEDWLYKMFHIKNPIHKDYYRNNV